MKLISKKFKKNKLRIIEAKIKKYNEFIIVSGLLFAIKTADKTEYWILNIPTMPNNKKACSGIPYNLIIDPYLINAKDHKISNTIINNE